MSERTLVLVEALLREVAPSSADLLRDVSQTLASHLDAIARLAESMARWPRVEPGDLKWLAHELRSVVAELHDPRLRP